MEHRRSQQRHRRLLVPPRPAPGAATGTTGLPGKRLRDVNLLEWIGDDMADGSIAIGFTFGADHLTVVNALDENGLAHQPPGPNYRHHPLTPQRPYR